MSIYVEVQRDIDSEALPSDEDFQTWTEAALSGRRDNGELCIRLVSCEESQQLNSEYRGKDKPTNVLSFPFESPPGVELDILGDLAICCDVVKTESNEQHKPLKHHWAHMVIHGVLHLIGFDHIKDAEAQEMEALEIQILASIGIDNPYELKQGN